ncbi:MAG: 4Fe-4S dicluster domain-containing protein [Candidatus Sumerlaeia bacterium]|nr:4Fe-4S dicluster domain-containing protein [Candidatus Sumerlaeia bacterium]
MFRHLLRAFILLTAVVLAGWGSPVGMLPALIPAASPFVALSSAAAQRMGDYVWLAAVPALILAVCIPRGFCRYACPVGFLHEEAASLGCKGQLKLLRLIAVGRAISLVTLGGALLGYPLFLWLDPLAQLSFYLNSIFNPRADWALLIAVLILPSIVLIGLLWPFFWCQRLCPLGGLQDLLIRTNALRRKQHPVAAPSDGSTLLAKSPNGAVFPARRAFLGLCAGALAAPLILAFRKKKAAVPLRPPGAAAEARFTGLCVRCGNCVRRCPAAIIRPDVARYGVASFMTPVLDFSEDYCRPDCRSCTQVCPSGALKRLSAAAKRAYRIGLAQVNCDLCLLANGAECTACITQCPYEAIAIESPDGGFTSQPAVDKQKCNGCGACEAVCPVRPHRAVRVLPGWQRK